MQRLLLAGLLAMSAPALAADSAPSQQGQKTTNKCEQDHIDRLVDPGFARVLQEKIRRACELKIEIKQCLAKNQAKVSSMKTGLGDDPIGLLTGSINNSCEHLMVEQRKLLLALGLNQDIPKDRRVVSVLPNYPYDEKPPLAVAKQD